LERRPAVKTTAAPQLRLLIKVLAGEKTYRGAEL
jgi:hypothetical protein